VDILKMTVDPTQEDAARLIATQARAANDAVTAAIRMGDQDLKRKRTDRLGEILDKIRLEEQFQKAKVVNGEAVRGETLQQ
jgi:hypothetical protein